MKHPEAEFWKSQFAERRITKREFIGRIGALGLTAATASSILALGSTARAQEPKKGGHLKVGWYSASASDTLNPARMASTTQFFYAWQVGNNLVRYSQQITPEPDLASEWDVTSDLKQWRFKIRKGVEFHNGKALTLDDIIYSLNLHRGESSASSIKPFLQPVADIRKDGDDVIVFEMSAPHADLAMLLGDVHAVIVPDGFDDWNNFIGTGPFKFKRFEPGIEVLAERNPNYFGRAAHIDSVSTIGIPDLAARVNALLAGDVDYIVRVDPKLVDAIEQAPNVAVASAKSSRRITFPMQMDATPFDNADLRLAIMLMADREGMVNNVLKGKGTVGNDIPVGPTDTYYNAKIPQRTQDLDKAKFHLKKAGMEGKSVTLHASDAAGGSIAPDLALHLKESAAKAGLTIDIQREPADGYWSNVWLKRPFAMGHLVVRPTADLTMSLIYHSKAPWNETHMKDAELDRILEQARGILDGPERQALYDQAQQIIHDRGGCLIPVHPDWLDARAEAVKGWVGSSLNEGDGCRLAENIWLDRDM